MIDDHPVLRQGVISILSKSFAGAEVREAANVAAAAQDGKVPDVVIVDPQHNSTDASSSLTELREVVDAPVVIFAASGDARMVADALKAGARAFVRKDSPSEVLAEAIDAARAGRYFVDPALGHDIEQGDGFEQGFLTERQRQILQLYADGAHTERVAKALNLSTETVRTHTKRVLAKLNASTRTHAVAIALRVRVLD